MKAKGLGRGTRVRTRREEDEDEIEKGEGQGEVLRLERVFPGEVPQPEEPMHHDRSIQVALPCNAVERARGKQSNEPSTWLAEVGDS
jgi:desulfoferrodoxin (superoxide reductase-like protein)